LATTAAAIDVEPQGLSLAEYLAIGKRRLRAILIAVAAGIVLTLAVAFLLPPRYQSTATILIEQQELPAELVRSTVTSYADERVQVISQRVLTTQTLLDIIKRYNLYPRQRERESREKLLARMRDDVAVKMISADVIDPRSGRPTSATIAFSLAYSNRSADQAAKVANELTTLFLDENLSSRTRLAQDAATFLAAEAERVSRHISELETKLAEFKSKHVEELPELMQLNMQLLDRNTQELQQLQTRRSALEQQQVYLEAQLAQLKPNSQMTSDSGERILSPEDRLKSLRSQLASAKARYAPDHPDIARLSREIAGLEAAQKDDAAADAHTADANDLRRQLEAARGELGAARERYAPDHPDRVRLERQVAALEKDVAAAESASSASSSTGPKPVADADNPAYIQIRAQLEATRNDLAALSQQEARTRADVDGYQRKVMLSPQIEREYRELTRDYDNSHAKYQELSLKQAEAVVAKNLETDRKGERFTLIEPPLVPTEPVSPNRALVLVLGIVLSLAAAFGAAALAESLDVTVRGRRDLMKLIGGVPPMAIIPRITEEVRRSRVQRVLVVGGSLAALACAAALAVHFLYMPLDVLWFVALRRLGLG
jgi:polysaccharide biosynthesis transport protein